MKKCYQQDFSSKSFFLSPVYAPEELLKKFPKTELMVTMDDPLAGDSFRFAEKLLNAGCDVFINEYPNAVHGVLSLGNKYIAPKYSEFVYDSIEILRKLLE